MCEHYKSKYYPQIMCIKIIWPTSFYEKFYSLTCHPLWKVFSNSLWADKVVLWDVCDTLFNYVYKSYCPIFYNFNYFIYGPVSQITRA